MQFYRAGNKIPTHQLTKMISYSYPRPCRNFNTFFPHFPVSDFAPLFRVLDDELNKAISNPLGAWQPRFDVREEKDSFYLQGELPGVESKDISIEFADENTLIIKGQTLRERTKSKPLESLEGSTFNKQNDADTDKSAEVDAPKSYQPTVEEEDNSTINSEKPLATPTTSSSEPKEKEKDSRYWMSERFVGKFHRSFNFPGHVNQDAVSASLKSGILNVIVPKAMAKEPKKIAIQ